MQTGTCSEALVTAPSLPRRRSGEGNGPTLAETARRRRDDWARAFAARLAWLGASDGAAELARLGRSLYEHYDLLDPYHIARMVWRRRPKGGGIVLPAAP